MKVAIRVDASQDIGTGHVRRCLALAVALRDLGGEVRFIARDLGLSVADLVNDYGFATITLAPPRAGDAVASAYSHGAWAGVSEEDDAAETVAVLRDWRPARVVVDHYAFAAHWHVNVRAKLGCRIVAIDDLADRPLAVDLLVDHNYSRDHRAKYDAVLDHPTVLLGGPRFALLGPAYASAPRYRPVADVRSIGIFMGGVDRDDASRLALRAIDAAGFAGAVEIVSTSANPNLASLARAVADRPQTSLALDLPDLAAFFARHDLQVGAAGGATWERCCIGAPTILLVVAENQKSVLPLLVEEKIVGAVYAFECAALSDMVTTLLDDPWTRLQFAQRSRNLVDGRGARRVAEAVMAQ